MGLDEYVSKVKEKWESDPQLKKNRDDVIAKYRKLFSLENIDNLTADQFQEFLRYENNKHWDRIQRPGGNLILDMNKLKNAIKILHDETISINERIKKIRDKDSPDYTVYFANALYTPILLMINETKYAVINDPVARALDKLDLFSYKKYSKDLEWETIPKMQEIVKDVAKKQGLDLWQVDWLWWDIANEKNDKISDKDFWLVGSGIEKEREAIWNEFKNNHIVGVGWNKTGDISNLSDKEIVQKFEDLDEAGATSLIEFKKIKPNDIIFVNDGKQGFFGIGRSIGDYRFDARYPINHHVIPVEWISTEYIKHKITGGNPNASCSRILKDKEELMKYLNMSQNTNRSFSDIEEYAKILKKGQQIIFFGAPGTGKTHYANLLAQYFTENSVTPTMTFRSAAIKILKDKGEPMHYNNIWKKAFEQKLVETRGKTPAETLLASITADIKTNGEDSIFRKTNTGTYELNSEEIEELKISEETESEKNQFLESVTFHPSYSYEDFIEGIKPSTEKGRIAYTLEDGIFKKICEKASADSKNKYVLLIDEINRGNISKIFGELITLIETKYREKPITLAYSKKSFSVPKNLYIIGTMNTADRSLVQIDTALRRRFSFIELMPKPEKLTKVIDGISLRKLLEKLNERIVEAGLREKQIGHTYLFDINTKEDLQFVFSYEIIPLLQDYFFNNYKKLQEEILSEYFIDSEKMIVKDEWKKDPDVLIEALKQTFEL